MIPTQPTQNIATYASEAPAEMLIPPGGTPVPQEEYQDGVRPLDTLPAAWWNWLWQKFSLEEQNIVSVLNSFHSELVNLLTEGGITTPSEASVTQIASAVKNIHERLATTSVAGSIKADSSTFGAIDVNSSTGVATMNGAGNGVLDTTPQNLTGAINELVSRIAALENAPVADSVPAGVMTAYGGETIPSGWLLCDGRALDRTTYASLFAAIGTKWGAGDGSTTFNIPDMQGRAPMGASTNAALGTMQNDATAVKGLKAGTYINSSSQTEYGSYNTSPIWAKYSRPLLSNSGGERYTLWAQAPSGDTASKYDVNLMSSSGKGYYVTLAALSTSPKYRMMPLELSFNTAMTTELSSTDTETRPKNARVNFIIKF